MDSMRNFTSGFSLKVAVLIFSISLLPFKPGGLDMSLSAQGLKEEKMMLGSIPPLCVNKCLSCRPCMATLVIPPHLKRKFKSSLEALDDRSYYHLSWKCICGTKLFSSLIFSVLYFTVNNDLILSDSSRS